MIVYTVYMGNAATRITTRAMKYIEKGHEPIDAIELACEKTPNVTERDREFARRLMIGLLARLEREAA